MALISYEQARADHEYLWSIGPAYDMTGGYVDQDDLSLLHASPNKKTARDVYRRQILYWFQVGPSITSDLDEIIPWYDKNVCDIAERHNCLPAFLKGTE